MISCPGRLAPYKLYVFLNPFRLDSGRRGALAEGAAEGRPDRPVDLRAGVHQDSPGLENMEELTGLRFGAGEQPWGPLVHITDFDHPVTRDLPRDLSWGTNNKLAPIFHVDDPEARVLGEVVYSQGNCRPGFAVKEFPDWRSVYSAAPNLPAPVLRGHRPRRRRPYLQRRRRRPLREPEPRSASIRSPAAERRHQAAAAGGHGRGPVLRPGDRPGSLPRSRSSWSPGRRRCSPSAGSGTPGLR